jgi:hypothetical protein
MILSVNFLVFTHAFVKFHKAPIKTLKLLVVQVVGTVAETEFRTAFSVTNKKNIAVTILTFT